MKLAIDVYYYAAKAKVVGVLFDQWDQSQPTEITTAYIEGIADYESGNFYKRELPCIIELLTLVDTNQIDCIIVDGYVFLDKQGKKGLGYYLYQAINETIPIIGVAKNYFHDTQALPLRRGDSKKPLYITSIGMDVEEAFRLVSSMDGDFRMPTLLKRLDQETRIL